MQPIGQEGRIVANGRSLSPAIRTRAMACLCAARGRSKCKTAAQIAKRGKNVAVGSEASGEACKAKAREILVTLSKWSYHLPCPLIHRHLGRRPMGKDGWIVSTATALDNAVVRLRLLQ